MAVSIDQFGKALVASGLMTADDVKAFWSALPGGGQPKDGEALAKALVSDGLLTEFQAKQILAGRGAALVLGEYVVLSEIGAGGMGHVYKAQHRRMKRIVALKAMSPSAMADAGAVKRFQREVEAAARLEHPNIVTAYDAGQSGKTTFLVMQFVDGCDLASLVKREGPLPVEQAVDYVIQAAQGLAFAHAEGVIHRDIKPANLLVDKKKVVKILDMGLARFESGGDGLTATEQVMGTVDYMSPEQAADTKHADARADVYSLGCTLWFLLTGRKLYDGDTLISRLMKHRDAPLPSLVKERDDASWPLEQVLHRMIAKRPQDRYQTMDEVIDALRPFRGDSSSASGAGSGSGVGKGASVGQSAELASFMQSLGSATQARSPTVAKAVPIARPATAHSVLSQPDTDPKTAMLTARNVTAVARGANKPAGRGGKRGNRTVLIGAGGVFGVAALLLGVWVVVRDKHGDKVAEVQVPEGGSVTVAPIASVSPTLPPQSSTAVAPSINPLGTPPAPTTATTLPSFTAGLANAPTPSPPAVADVADDDGGKHWVFDEWRPLFDGKSLEGWTGDVRILSVEDGALVAAAGRGVVVMPGAKTSDGKYKDFELELEFRLGDGGNSGVGIHYAGDGDPAKNGVEVQLLDDEAYPNITDDQRCGSIYKLAAAKPGACKRGPEWNLLKISSLGRDLVVELNGIAVVRTTKPIIARAHPEIASTTFAPGGICLFPHSGRSEYRNLRIRTAAWMPTTIASAPPTSAAPSAASAAIADQAATIDILASIDLTRDVVAGNWRLVNGVLLTPPIENGVNTARLHLSTPSPMPAEYDVDLTVERRGTGPGMVFGFLMGGRQATVMMDSYSKPPLWGIERIDAKNLKDNGTAQPGERLTAGVRKDVRIEVRRDGVRAFCAGEQAFDWRGRPEQLSTEFWDVPNKNSLFLGSQANFHVSRIRLTPRNSAQPSPTPVNVAAPSAAPPPINPNVGAPTTTFVLSPSAPALVSSVNTASTEQDPWLSADGLRLYVGRDGAIVVCARPRVGEPFGPPQVVASGRMPTLSADELELFCVQKDADGKERLVTAVRSSIEQAFGAPRDVPALNTGNKVAKSPSLSPDGRTLFFNFGAGGENDLVYSTRPDRRSMFGPPQPLSINLPSGWESVLTWPWVSADGRTLLCVGERMAPGGGRLLRLTRSDSNLPFGKPEPITIGGRVLYGRAPRIVVETGELFFSGTADLGDQTTWPTAKWDVWTVPGFAAAATSSVAASNAVPTVAATAPAAAPTDFKGWRGLPAYWKVRETEVTASITPGELATNTYFVAPDTYRDFELTCRVKLTAGNSGIQIRSAYADPAQFVMRGPQVDFGAGYWGSLYGEMAGGMMQAADPQLENRIIRSNDFNDVVVRCYGKHVTIRINGETTVDGDFPTMPDDGRIGLQLHTGRCEVVFRDLSIRRLRPDGTDFSTTPAPGGATTPAPRTTAKPKTAAAGFTPLFNGRDLTGWGFPGGGTGNWIVQQGTITCTGGGFNRLYTQRSDFRDFHLRAEVMINDGGNGGLHFRTPPGMVAGGGYEAQVNSTAQGCRTGGLYIIGEGGGLANNVPQSLVPPNTWFMLEVVVRGSRIGILVDGVATTDYVDAKNLFTQGHVALEHNNPQSRIFFRKVEIKELTGAAQ